MKQLSSINTSYTQHSRSLPTFRAYNTTLAHTWSFYGIHAPKDVPCTQATTEFSFGTPRFFDSRSTYVTPHQLHIFIQDSNQEQQNSLRDRFTIIPGVRGLTPAYGEAIVI